MGRSTTDGLIGHRFPCFERGVEEALREELQTCRKEVLDAVKAEAAERLESAARMEKDRHSALKEEATVRRAVATHLETRLTKVAASIETVHAELQKVAESRHAEVMPTLQENSNEEHLARLDEALEREALARQELERSLSFRFEVVAQQLFLRCQQGHQTHQSPREHALDSASGRCIGTIALHHGSTETARCHPSEERDSVSSIVDGPLCGRMQAGSARMSGASNNAAQQQRRQQQQPQLASPFSVPCDQEERCAASGSRRCGTPGVGGTLTSTPKVGDKNLLLRFCL